MKLSTRNSLGYELILPTCFSGCRSPTEHLLRNGRLPNSRVARQERRAIGCECCQSVEQTATTSSTICYFDMGGGHTRALKG